MLPTQALGLKLRGQVLSVHTQTETHKQNHKQRGCRVRWHTTAVPDWLISISITQPSDIAVHTLGQNTLIQWAREKHTHNCMCTHRPCAHTLYPMQSHQPLHLSCASVAADRWQEGQEEKDNLSERGRQRRKKEHKLSGSHRAIWVV